MVLGTRDTADPHPPAAGDRTLEKREGCQISGKDAPVLRLRFTVGENSPDETELCDPTVFFHFYIWSLSSFSSPRKYVSPRDQVGLGTNLLLFTN